MVMAVTEAALAAEVAQANGLAFVALCDPRVSQTEAREALRTQVKSPLDASCTADAFAPLLRPEDWQHAPTMIVRTRGALQPRRITGVMPAPALQALVRERLAP